MAKTQHQFQAEIQQLLNLVVHSLYSKKEIFLRELISNASDAIDKRRFLAITRPEWAATDYFIELEPNEKEKTLKIRDNGIGMNEQEVVDYIGTIAKSGTKRFIELHEQLKKNPEMIGQFGVGFYSAFMVANKVVIHTQKVGESQGVIWESTGEGSYFISHAPRPEGTGTTITLHLKTFDAEEQPQEFWQDWVIRDLVKKYSNYIAYPIKLILEKKEPEVINSQKAIWQKNPQEVTNEEYQDFYRHISHDWGNAQKWWHWRVEGNVEFYGLIFVPEKKPWNYNLKDYDYGLSLYIKKVLIMDNNKDLIPPYLRFLKGLVDCSDLPLNVSREILQNNRLIQVIKKNVLNKIFTGFKELLEKDRQLYEKIYENFGATLKEGIPSDPGNKDKIAELLLFRSSKTLKWISLDEYISQMQAGQSQIYYLIGESLERIQNSPYLEKLQEKNYEVLLMSDPVDEWVTRELTQYKNFSLKSIMDQDLDFDTIEEKRIKQERIREKEELIKNLFEQVKNSLPHIKEVRLSSRLTKSPSCLVMESGSLSPHMQKFLKQIGEVSSGYPPIGQSLRILELNPDHPMVEHLTKLKTDEEKASWLELLYYQALISEGSPLDNPHRFTDLLTKVLVKQEASRIILPFQ
ncbi:MAG: molecular chaperone HtpG [Bdellovibrionaceae bacterium]|nr:molecular chaperone HtpG [Pseudobdellovibrionaceae bacterium]MDW8190593.1 molecular chaperone HtpG [Pseudobdellovibrionaceae bacterium]